MKIEIYIGTDKLDFDDSINVVFSIGDFRNLNIGSNNKSYTLNVPLTKNNKKILGNINVPTTRQEISSEGRIYLNGAEILKGTVKVLPVNNTSAKIIIDSNDWADALDSVKLEDVPGLSSEAVTLTAAHVSDSWTAVDPFIRFGMIFFAEMWSETRGYWKTHDFVPMFSVVQMLSLIFAPYTIVSDWIATAYAKKMFFLGVEPRKATEYLLRKNLSVQPANDTENQDIFNIPATTRDTKSFAFSPVSNNTEITDEGSDYNTTTDEYTVPETGTYRFQWICKSKVTNLTSGDITKHSITVTKSILVTYAIGGGDTLATYNVTGSSDPAVIDNHSITLDTDYIHLSAGDVITCYMAVQYDLENTSGGAIDITTYIDSTLPSNLSNVWDYRNLYAGIGKSLNPADYMPDKSALDFLQAIKHVCNLRFFMDKRNGTVHIEPADTFFTNNDVDLSDNVIDFEDTESDLIASEYNKSTILGWAEDNTDKVYVRYVEDYGIPYQKNISLSSVYAQEGEVKMLNMMFASTARVNNYSDPYDLPAIHGGEDYLGTDYNQRYPKQRAVGYAPRILTWEGMSAYSTWYYNDAAQTTYPEMAPIDFATLYASYYLKTFHYIDGGRIIRVKIKMTPQLLMQFMGVVSNASSEAFRARYKLWTGNEYIYLMLQKITTDGDQAIGEFTLKQ